MASRRSSGSRRRPRAVDPTRSTNMTLTSRRSGSETGAALCPGRPSASRGAPQSPQNRLSAGFSPEHTPQTHGIGVPQSPQNLLCEATWAPQRGQIIGPAFLRVRGAQASCGEPEWIRLLGGGANVPSGLENVPRDHYYTKPAGLDVTYVTPKIVARRAGAKIKTEPKNSDVTLEGGRLPPDVKTTSVLRRVQLPPELYYVEVPGLEGHVCAFQLAATSSPIFVEAVSGRVQTLIPGDVFLGTPGHRESNIVLLGGIPQVGLIPGNRYSVISDSGVVGELITETPLAKKFA